ncbi:hypothetical protein KA001_02430 [Patescibacteria group bacterium]|nr:hypothetical protein [Patescibacteria group bacterium]
MENKNTFNSAASTQEHLDIYDIKDNLLILKNGTATAVIEAGAINFDLLSQREQDAAIMAYSGLLNSLSFPIQIVISSKILDISSYVKKIEKAQTNIQIELLKNACTDYKNFVTSLVQNYSVLNKRFFIAISHSKNNALPTTSAFGWFSDLLGIKTKPINRLDVNEVIQKAKSEIDPRVEHIMKELKRININSKRLNTEDLIKLFYEIYNEGGNEEKSLSNNEYDTSSELIEVLQ